MTSDSPKRTDPVTEVWDPQREIERWRAQYLAVKAKLEQLAREAGRSETELEALGEAGGSLAQDDRRTEPRYNFATDSRIFAHMGPKAFKILNISVGGIAFFSDVAFEPGAKLLMSALGLIAMEVEVLSCEMEETDPDLMEYHYRVRARFSPMVNGYQVYVLAREMYLEQAKGAQATP